MSTDTTPSAARIQRLAGDIADHHDDDLKTYTATQEIIADALALEAALEDAIQRMPEERGLMICPFCDGTSPSGYTDALALEPSYPCGGCEGARYINPARLATHLVAHPDDPWGAFVAAVLTDEEGQWV